MWYIYTMEYYSAMKKAIMPSAPTRMYPVIITPNEVSQRKTNTVWYHLHVGSKNIIQMNLFTSRDRLTDIENQLMVTKGEKGERKINEELGMNRYTLLCIKQISNKGLLYSKVNDT